MSIDYYMTLYDGLPALMIVDDDNTTMFKLPGEGSEKLKEYYRAQVHYAVDINILLNHSIVLHNWHASVLLLMEGKEQGTESDYVLTVPEDKFKKLQNALIDFKVQMTLENANCQFVIENQYMSVAKLFECKSELLPNQDCADMFTLKRLLKSYTPTEKNGYVVNATVCGSERDIIKLETPIGSVLLTPDVSVDSEVYNVDIYLQMVPEFIVSIASALTKLNIC